MEEVDDAYLLEAELPGVEREDVTVELVGNELTITGEVKDKERTGVVRRRGRRSGRFQYRISLPEQIKPDELDASLADGVLKLRVPKSERAAAEDRAQASEQNAERIRRVRVLRDADRCRASRVRRR